MTGCTQRRSRLTWPVVRAAAVVCLVAHGAFAQPNGPEPPAITSAKRMLRDAPITAVRDSLVRLAFTQILNNVSLQSQDIYIIGTRIQDKDPAFFLGALLRGYYLSAIATDRRGHQQARLELERALRAWPHDRYAPHAGSLDAQVAAQFLAGVSQEQQFFTYMITYQYLQLNYQLSNSYLELNEARRAFEVTRELLDRHFTYDFYSLHRLAWLFYKYRYFTRGEDYPFLLGSQRENVRRAIDLSNLELEKIRAYRTVKYSYPRYWMDDNTLSWYEEGAKNILSIAYGVMWNNDSSIVFYERIPSWYQIRNNGTYTYLAALDYRAAERQFAMVGKAGGAPMSVISQPTAIESYKNMLIYKGTPEEGYVYLNDYARKYQTDRGWAMSWTGTINYWNGHLLESIRNLNIARQYPEVFGNISFNRTHYDMLALTQQSLSYEALANAIAFEPNTAKGFFARIWNAIVRFVMKWYYRFMAFLCRHWAIDQYLQVEDRAEYLKVFYPENLLDYFQTWNIVGHLDPAWHLRALREAKQGDRRPRAQRYYAVFEADLLRRLGREAEAWNLLHPGGRDFRASADTAYEKLLIAMAENETVSILEDRGEDTQAARHVVAMYASYPQAVSLWGRTLPLRFDRSDVSLLAVSGSQRDTIDQALAVFERYDFDRDTKYPFDVPRLRLSVSSRGGGLHIGYTVTLANRVIARGDCQSLSRDRTRPVSLPPAELARRIAYGVFRIVPKDAEHPPA
jgi:hypothetical protein